MNAPFSMTKELVRFILTHASQFTWSLQGFGMLRLYLPKESGLRLCVWDHRFERPGVSLIHSHPWDFRSLVVSGELRNHRYTACEPNEGDDPTHLVSAIKCGERGGLEGEPKGVMLFAQPEEVHREGTLYGQMSSEIHHTDFANGTITLCHRQVPPGGDADHALVFWRAGEQWGSAEPRTATAYEVAEITGLALDLML